MKLKPIFALLTMAFVGSSFAAADPTCSGVISLFESVDPSEFEGCVCDRRLANLHAPLRSPFRVAAACRFQWGVGRPIDLGRERVRLDRYTNGNYPSGVLFITGEARLDGILLYEPGPAGEFWFSPDVPLLNNNKQRPGLPDMKFTEEPPPGLRIPIPFRDKNCWQSKVTLSVKGIRAVLWDNDEAGSWPAVYRVQRAREFTLCTQ